MSDFNKSISQEQLPMQRLPDVIIMGVKKSGTMTLGEEQLDYKFE